LYIVFLPFYWYFFSTVFFLPLRFTFYLLPFLINIFNELIVLSLLFLPLFFGTAKINIIF
jgi:hypothetical protein